MLTVGKDAADVERLLSVNSGWHHLPVLRMPGRGEALENAVQVNIETSAVLNAVAGIGAPVAIRPPAQWLMPQTR